MSQNPKGKSSLDLSLSHALSLALSAPLSLEVDLSVWHALSPGFYVLQPVDPEKRDREVQKVDLSVL